MGMDLSGEGGYYRFSNVGWGKVWELARQYGWEPTADWDSYILNAYQTVDSEDAALLADALERALPDIPDFDTDEKLREYAPGDPPTDPVMQLLVEAVGAGIGPNDSLSPVEFFSGEAKEKVQDFIAYCRAGAFTIG